MRIGIYCGARRLDGGSFQHEAAILEGLRDHAASSGHRFLVFGTGFEHDVLRLRAPHIEFVATSSGRLPLWRRVRRRALRDVRKWLGVKIELEDEGADISRPGIVGRHRVDLMYYPGPYAVCLEVDAPYVFTVFDLEHRHHPEFPEVSLHGEWIARERVFSVAVPRAFAVVTDSEAGKEDVTRFYNIDECRVRVLPYVPPLSRMLRKDDDGGRHVLDKYGIPASYIFYPAQLWPHKNHSGLLEAMSILSQSDGIDLPVVFVGSDQGNLDHVMRLAARLGLQSKVHYLGFVPDEDMQALYRQAFALVMPTLFGPTNIPIWEAFALGCPVITSDIRGAREQTDGAALLADPRNPGEICERIRVLHRDATLRQTLIDRGLSRVRRWSIRDYVQGLMAVFADFESVRRCWGGDP